MKYKILEHKADLKIKVFGKTKKELFENAMVGMFKAAKYETTKRLTTKRLTTKRLTTKRLTTKRLTTKRLAIKIKSIDLPSLLVDFLSEVLYLAETKKLVFEKVEFKKFTENEIEAKLTGNQLKRMGIHIKGVTYHELDIRQKKDGTWQATILFDI
jgi:SHS2 domain-containing protein